MRRIRACSEVAAIQSAPLGDRAKAIQMELRGRLRHKEATERKGGQVRPAEFTKYLHEIHEQAKFMPIEPKRFEVEMDFVRIVEEVILKAKKGKAVGSDGTHVEMYKGAPRRCAELLKCWWNTAGRLRIMLTDWTEGTIFRLHKKGDQSRPENYRPFCLLSPTWKIIDTAVLVKINRVLSPTKA